MIDTANDYNNEPEIGVAIKKSAWGGWTRVQGATPRRNAHVGA